MVEVSENVRKSLCILSNDNIVNYDVFKKLSENCFAVLQGKPEVHGMNVILGSKPDIIKDAYAALMMVTTDYVRKAIPGPEVTHYFLQQCNISKAKVECYMHSFDYNRQLIGAHLLNIGTYLPHITDVNWKINYIVKSNQSDESKGPLVHVSFQTEISDRESEKKWQHVDFSCTPQALQDLVNTLKDAVRHCQQIATEH